MAPFSAPCNPLSSGLPSLDDILQGGLDPGSITEVFGPPASGKSALALRFAAGAQAIGVTPIILDTEKSFSTDFAKRLGLSLSGALISTTDNHETALRSAMSMLDVSQPKLIIIDSVAAINPTKGSRFRTQHDLLHHYLFPLRDYIRATRNFAILVNQTRRKSDPYADPRFIARYAREDPTYFQTLRTDSIEVTAAGNVHLFADYRIRVGETRLLYPDGNCTTDTDPYGISINCKLLRHHGNHLCRSTRLLLDFYHGFLIDSET